MYSHLCNPAILADEITHAEQLLRIYGSADVVTRAQINSAANVAERLYPGTKQAIRDVSPDMPADTILKCLRAKLALETASAKAGI